MNLKKKSTESAQEKAWDWGEWKIHGEFQNLHYQFFHQRKVIRRSDNRLTAPGAVSIRLSKTIFCEQVQLINYKSSFPRLDCLIYRTMTEILSKTWWACQQILIVINSKVVTKVNWYCVISCNAKQRRGKTQAQNPNQYPKTNPDKFIMSQQTNSYHRAEENHDKA